MRSLCLPLTLLAVMFPVSAAIAGTSPPAFEVCAACHTGRADALGPELKGVVGRPAGTLPGFRYSNAMRKSAITWAPETLRSFLMGPQTVVPGNRMPLAPMSKADADSVVSYLATVK